MATSATKQTAHQGVTAGAQIIPGLPTGGRGGRLHLVWLTPAAANATVVVTDGITAGGPQLANVAAQTPWSNGNDFDVEFQKGLWVVVTGVGADVQITWE